MDIFDLSAVIRLDSTEYEQGLSDAEEKAKSLGDSFQTAAKVGTTAFAAVSTAIVGTGAALVKGTGEVASYGDNIDKMSQKMGISAKAYQEWDAVLRHSGTSINSLKPSMKTLAVQAEKGSDAFQKLGISQEEVASLSQEELFARTIEGLQNMEQGSERTAIASQLLGKGATELGALLNTSAEDTQKMKDRVNELGGVMSDKAVKAAARYQDSLQDMNTAISGISRGILSEFMPSIADVMDGLTEIFGGDGESGVAMVSQGISGIINTISATVPKLMETGGAIFSALEQAIVENLPSIAQKGTEIVVSLVTSILSAVPTLAESAFTIISTITSTIIESLPMLLDSGFQVVDQLGSGIIQNIPSAISAFTDLLSQCVDFILEKLPDFLEKGVDIISNIVDGILDNLPEMVEAMEEGMGNLIDNILEKLPQFLEKGIEIITNIANGILQNLPAILASIGSILTSLISTIVAKLPDFLAKGGEIIATLAKAFSASIPSILATMGEVILRIIEEIATHLPEFLQKGGEIIANVAGGILSSVGDIVGSMASVIGDVISEIANNLSNFLSKGGEIVGNLLSGISGAASDVINYMSDFVNNLADRFLSFDWLSVGGNIVAGMKDGILNGAEWLINAAINVASDVYHSVLRWFGIESPSKLMKNKVGKNISLGWAEGIEDAGPEVIGAMEDITDDMLDVVPDEIPITDTEIKTSKFSDGTNVKSGALNFAPVINVYASEDQNVEDLADAVMERMTFMYERERAVYETA